MKKFNFLFLFIFFTSCGESPLLNHKLEENFNLSDISLAQSDELKFKTSGLSFTVDWSEPPRTGEGQFLLKIWKSDQGTVNGPYQDPESNIHIFLWMPSMGHGSAPVKIARTASGEYKITNVFFIMGGKWEVKFQLLSSGKVVDETVLTYNL